MDHSDSTSGPEEPPTQLELSRKERKKVGRKRREDLDDQASSTTGSTGTGGGLPHFDTHEGVGGHEGLPPGHMSPASPTPSTPGMRHVSPFGMIDDDDPSPRHPSQQETRRTAYSVSSHASLSPPLAALDDHHHHPTASSSREAFSLDAAEQQQYTAAPSSPPGGRHATHGGGDGGDGGGEIPQNTAAPAPSGHSSHHPLGESFTPPEYGSFPSVPASLGSTQESAGSAALKAAQGPGSADLSGVGGRPKRAAKVSFQESPPLAATPESGGGVAAVPAAAAAAVAVPGAAVAAGDALLLSSKGMIGSRKTKTPLTMDRADASKPAMQSPTPQEVPPEYDLVNRERRVVRAEQQVQHLSKRPTSRKLSAPAGSLVTKAKVGKVKGRAISPHVPVSTRLLERDNAPRVTCVACTAQSYNMEDLKDTFLRAFPSSTFVSHDTQLESEVAHISVPTNDWNSDADVFVFAYGSVAYWGPNEKDLWSDVVDTLAHVSNNPILDFDCEVLTWGYSKPYEFPMSTSASESDYRSVEEGGKAKFKYSWLDQDHFYLASTEADIKLAFSHAVGQSEKLSHYEERIDEQIHSTRRYPEELASNGEVTLSGKAIARTKGLLFLHRMNIILHTDLLDTPDFFWERTDLEPLYIHARKYFEISRRVRVLNERLGVVAELFDMLHEQQKQKHSDKLEWIVIWLIAIEIVVSGLTIYLKVFPLDNACETPVPA